MSETPEQQPSDQRPTSKKDAVMYGRVTKKKEKDLIRFTEKVHKEIFNYRDTFKSAFGFSGTGMAVISPDGDILDVNNAFCTFTGYTYNELIELNFLEIGHPDDNHNDELLLNRMLSNVLNYYTLEKRYISKNNHILWGVHTVSKVHDEKGQILHYVLQVSDITNQKNLTDQLNRKNSELEAIRSGLINRINQLEELNHIIAHNLRGPANNIVLLVQMLRDQMEGKKADAPVTDINEIVNFLQDGSTSLVSSLNTLMDVVKLSMSRDIPFDDCDVPVMCREIMDQLNSVIFESGAFIQLDLGIKTIHYPRVFLESIIYNLLSNALKYVSPERIPEILIRTYELDGHIALSVKDNGLGIDLNKYGSKIFKLNQVFHKHPDSKGVGLYITRAQIESFGGTIQVVSKVNEGSEFIVKL